MTFEQSKVLRCKRGDSANECIVLLVNIVYVAVCRNISNALMLKVVLTTLKSLKE